MYIEKRTERSRVLLQKNETFSRSFPFFYKERNVLCVLLGFISHQKLEKSRKERKRTEHSFFRREKNETYRMEKNGVPNPA